MSAPRFSVIMAAYNAAATIESSVASVLAQTERDFELVVVDDGSTDDTAALVRAFDDERIVLVQQENHGLGAARATALRHARGAYVGVLDSDDLYLPRYLELHGAALDGADAGVGFAYSDAWVLELPARRIRRRTSSAYVDPPVPPPDTAESFLLEMLRRNFVSALATIRRSVLEETGPWNPRFRSAEDYELWLRVLAHGYRGVLVPGLHLVIRDRPGSLTKAATTMLESRRDVYRVLLEEYPNVSEEARRVAQEEYDRYDRQLQRQLDRSAAARVRTRLRRAAGAVRRSLVRHRRYRETPPELREAFPDVEFA
jgi:glycosyltransferase involved in cell wall biosynthesis